MTRSDNALHFPCNKRLTHTSGPELKRRRWRSKRLYRLFQATELPPRIARSVAHALRTGRLTEAEWLMKPHFKFIDFLFHPRRRALALGRSPLRVVREVLILQLLRESFAIRFFQNGKRKTGDG